MAALTTSEAITSVTSDFVKHTLYDIYDLNSVLQRITIAELSNTYSVFCKQLLEDTPNINTLGCVRIFQIMVELSMVTTHPVVELSSGTSEPIKITNFNIYSELDTDESHRYLVGIDITPELVLILIDIAKDLKLKNIAPVGVHGDMIALPLRWVVSDTTMQLHIGII